MLENITRIAITEHLEIDVASSGSRHVKPLPYLMKGTFSPQREQNAL